jgi:ATP-dependent protease ClpP protease subunit
MSDMMYVPQNRMLEEMKLNDYLKENIIYLDCEIDRESQVIFCRQLKRLAEQELKRSIEDRKNIKVKISSFGGWVCSVFAMISYMEYWQEQGIIIETYCDGYTASGGSKILMAGSKGYRYITRYGTVLIHQSNSYKQGYSTLQEDVKSVEESLKDWDTLKGIFRKHTKLTEEEIFNFTDKNIDFTYRPQECLEKGLVDHII